MLLPLQHKYTCAGSQNAPRKTPISHYKLFESLYPIPQMIKSLPETLQLEVMGKLISRERLVKDCFTRQDAIRTISPYEDPISHRFVKFIARQANQQDGEDDRLLQQSLSRGHSLMFDALLKVTKRPKVNPLLVIASQNNDTEAFGKLLHTARKNRNKISLTTLHTVASLGQQSHLEALFRLSSPTQVEKQFLEHLAQTQNRLIQQFRGLNPEQRKQLLFEKLKDPGRVTPEQLPYIIVALLHLGVNVNAVDETGLTPLHIASKQGYEDAVNTLILAGADVNAADIKGNTPLHSAVDNGQEAVVNALIQADEINVNAVNKERATPLHRVAFRGQENIVNALIQAGAKVNLVTIDGFTPLHFAAEAGHEAVVNRLVQVDGIKVNIAAVNDLTPLHLAAETGQEGVINILIEANANKNALTLDKQTPLQMAEANNHTHVYQLLSGA